MESLGIKTEPEEVVADSVFSIDHIAGYTPVSEKGYTLFWANGYKFWAAIPFMEFDRIFKAGVDRFNGMVPAI